MIRRPGILPAIVSLGLLLALALLLDPAAIAGHIDGVDPRWLIAALAVGTLQFALSAERWRRTAARLDVPLGKRRALADYYIAGFANQVLPGGVLGDAGRAWRHSRSSGQTGPAVRAVILERASGQAMLLLAVLVTLVATAPGQRLLELLIERLNPSTKPAWMAVALGLVLLGALTFIVTRHGRLPRWLTSLGRDANHALLARRAWPIQLLLSLIVLASYCAMFAFAGRMIGAEVSTSMLFVLAPVVLLAMLLPISVAGWGVRETAAAGVWVAMGWPAAEGVAISVAYGVLCLVASLPGAVFSVLLPMRHARKTL